MWRAGRAAWDQVKVGGETEMSSWLGLGRRGQRGEGNGPEAQAIGIMLQLEARAGSCRRGRESVHHLSHEYEKGIFAGQKMHVHVIYTKRTCSNGLDEPRHLGERTGSTHSVDASIEFRIIRHLCGATLQVSDIIKQQSCEASADVRAYFAQTTLPLVVTRPSSLTLTSTTVPLVMTPSWVYMGDCGFFLTPMMGSWNVACNSGCVTLAFFMRRAIGRMKRSIFTGLRVKLSGTKVAAHQLMVSAQDTTVGHDVRTFGHHAFPAFLLALARLHHLEDLFFRNPTDLGQRNRILARFFLPLLLERTAKRLGLVLLLPI